MKKFSEWLVSEVGMAGVTGGVNPPVNSTAVKPTVTSTTTTPDPKLNSTIKTAVSNDMKTKDGASLANLIKAKPKEFAGLLAQLVAGKVIK